MTAGALVGAAPDEVERADADVGRAARVRDAPRASEEAEEHAERGDLARERPGGRVDPGSAGEVVEPEGVCVGDGAADTARSEVDVGVREEEELRRGRLAGDGGGSNGQRMVLAEPARRKRRHVVDLDAGGSGGEGVHDLPRSIRRAVVHEHDLKIVV